MGLSGSGKSTLIRHINRLIEPTSGKIYVDDEDVVSMSRQALRDFRRFKTSMVFQNFGLFIHKTVTENVAYGLKIQGKPSQHIQERTAEWIDRVGLNGYEDHYPQQLSGGMRQRVGLARALAPNTQILLMDEAFSALDPLIRFDMQNMLLKLQDELHKTVVFITHDLEEALQLGDQVAILQDGEVIQNSSPQDIILHPTNDYVFDFVKDINRARILKIKAIMRKGNGTATGLSLSKETLLEEALQRVAKTENHTADVTDEHGRLVGQVSLEQIVKAIARPEIAPTE